MGLSLKATTHYNKWTKNQVLFKDNTAAVDLRPVFKAQVTIYNSNMVAINVVAKRANADLSGMTSAKELSKAKTADLFGAITKNAFSFAAINNLTELEEQMANSTDAKLLAEKDEDFGPRCSNINDVLTQALADYPTATDYFTAGELTAAMAEETKFEGKLGKWAVAEKDVNDAKMEFEDDWMPTMTKLLLVLESMLPGTITTTYPKFVDAFIALKKLVNVGKKDQGVDVTMDDADTGALFIDNGKMETINYKAKKQKTAMTSSLGLFPLMKLKVGIWKIRFSSPGYVTQTIEVKIEARKVLKVGVKMVKV